MVMYTNSSLLNMRLLFFDKILLNRNAAIVWRYTYEVRVIFLRKILRIIIDEGKSCVRFGTLVGHTVMRFIANLVNILHTTRIRNLSLFYPASCRQ